ncbi:MAG TPA: hypothetical protein VHB98_24265, partial [Chloroflexota bacterium]|nr:hypothetical protein [Chloroflexota bacterium]
MRYLSRPIAALAVVCIAVVPAQLVHLSSAPIAKANNYQMNPAPFTGFKAPISTPALMALERTTGSKTWGPDAAALHRSAAIPAPSANTTSTAPPGLLLFNTDQSATEQTETSLTQATPGGPVVGGVNDFRGFDFVPAAGCTVTGSTQCYPALNCVSLSGFSVASVNGSPFAVSSGLTLLKSGCLPQVITGGTTFQPFGDPALDHDAQGTVYYGSLGFDAAGGPSNGIILEKGTPALTTAGTTCQNTSATSNPCWTGRVVSIGTNVTANGCSVAVCTFADKDWVAVDRASNTPYRGSVYVVWNQFTLSGSAGGTSHMVLSRCTPSASDPTGFSGCTAPIVVSQPGDIFTGGGSYVAVGADGHVYVAYYNFGTPTTLYPVIGRVAVLSPGATSVLGYVNVARLTQAGTADTYPCLPNTDPPGALYAGAPCKDNTYPEDVYSSPFRLPGFIKITVDSAPRRYANRVFTTFELCSQPAYYAAADSQGDILYTGNCPKTDVIVTHNDVSFSAGGALSAGPESAIDITQHSPGQQFFPYPSTDEFTHALVITYESTQNDPFNNMIDVYAQVSRDGGSTFTPLVNPAFHGRGNLQPGRITPSSYQVSADPSMYFGQGAPFCTGFSAETGCAGFAPQNGDYLQGVASGGRLYVHFNATYVQKGFAAPPNSLTFVDNANPVFQEDNYLAS